MRPANAANPYADYSEKQLYDFLVSYDLPRDPGVKWVYSNLGFGLLGLALARRAGTSYGTLVQERICQPLGMQSTTTVTTPSMAQRLAMGHSRDLSTVPSWTFTKATAGAGGYASFIAYDPVSASAVVVLSNSDNSVYDLGMHLLDSR